MAEALRVAALGRYTVHPNPAVGCVLVRGDSIVGRGAHWRAGEPHAEVYALRQAGAAARGATAYVTLEPCAHHGRTPPCCDALIAAGVSRVVLALRDPNPLVAGQGALRLVAAGIQVTEGVLADAARELNPGFLKRMETGRPWVRVKLAASLDGRTAMASGESQWITGPAARRDGQRFRARAGAILTGIGTVLADDPQLTVRESIASLLALEGYSEADYCAAVPAGALALAELPPPAPLRVVLDPQLRMPSTARMLAGLHGDAHESAGGMQIHGAQTLGVQTPASVLIFTTEELQYSAKADRLRAAGAEVVGLARRSVVQGAPVQGALGKDALGQGAVGQGSLGQGALGKDALGKDALGLGSVRHDSVRQISVRQGPAANRLASEGAGGKGSESQKSVANGLGTNVFGGQLDLDAVFRELARRQINEVHVEAGARLAGALTAAGWVDEYLMYWAPCLLGSNARPLLELPLIRMAERMPLTLTSCDVLGSDLRIRARPATVFV